MLITLATSVAYADNITLPIPPSFSSEQACETFVNDNYVMKLMMNTDVSINVVKFFSQFRSFSMAPSRQECSNGQCTNYIYYNSRMIPNAGGCQMIGTKAWPEIYSSLQQEVSQFNADNHTTGLPAYTYGFHGPSNTCTFGGTTYQNCTLDKKAW